MNALSVVGRGRRACLGIPDDLSIAREKEKQKVRKDNRRQKEKKNKKKT